MNIVLTGFMASGKTQISKCIAKMSGFNLVDTDQLIVEQSLIMSSFQRVAVLY